MRISAIRGLGVLLAIGVAATSLSAQAPAGQAPGRGGQDVQVIANKLAPNFYALQANGLSTVGVLVGPDGVLMVDSGTAALTEKIVAAIKGVSDRPIRFLINTHLHPDHTGGNENFANMGVPIIGRDELRAGLAKNPATKPGTLPIVTYSGSMTFHMNGEDVQLIPVPAAHTNGDTMVRFPTSNVIMCGDFFRSLGYPNIDQANGGSLKGVLDGLNVLIQTANADTKIVPGHGVIVDKAAVAAHRDMIIVIRDKVDAMVKQGKTQAEIIAAKPTADYDAKVPSASTTSDRFIGQLYADLGGK